MRNDINIAIVAMVEQLPPTALRNSSSVSCYVLEDPTNSTIVQVSFQTKYFFKFIQLYEIVTV